MRAVRALNRQRIMEIKAERLANGNIMATDCLGQLGHANEATIAGGGGEGSIRMDKVLHGDSPVSVTLLRRTCVRRAIRTERGPEASRQK